MKKRYFPIVLSLLILFTTTDIYPKEKFIIKKFNNHVKRSLKKWGVPGMAVGVMYDGYIILAKGYGFGDLEKKLPVTRYTMFPIGSATKAFTAFVAGKLVETGVFSWEDKVKKYLKGFKLYDAYASDNMRILDLFLHNSGLPRHDLVWYGSDKSRKELFEGLKFLKNNKGFRTVFQYQNLMYMTAGFLEEKVTGSSWEEQVKKYILAPLEMECTNFSIEDMVKSDNFALPYSEKDGAVSRIPFYREMEGIGPAGSINSNVYDMLKWVKLNLDRGKWDGKSLIGKKSLDFIHTPHMIAGGVITSKIGKFKEFSYPTYGVGWFINHYRGAKMIHHGGSIDGFSSVVTLMPDKNAAVVVLTNKENHLLTYAIALHIYDKLRGLKPIDWNERFMKVLDEIKRKNLESRKEVVEKKNDKSTVYDFSQLIGVYEHPAYGKIEIAVKDGKLDFKFNKFKSDLENNGNNMFTIKTSILAGRKVKFGKDNDMKVFSLSIKLEKSVDSIVFLMKD